MKNYPCRRNPLGRRTWCTRSFLRSMSPAILKNRKIGHEYPRRLLQDRQSLSDWAHFLSIAIDTKNMLCLENNSLEVLKCDSPLLFEELFESAYLNPVLLEEKSRS